MSFSRIISGKMIANNDDRLRLSRETQHAFVRCDKARIQNEHTRVRRRTVPRPLEGEASTSRSRMSKDLHLMATSPLITYTGGSSYYCT